MQRENEEATPIAGYHHEEVEVFEMPSIEALEQIENDTNYSFKKSTVVFQNDWHKGVVGIVASRLIDF